MFRRPKFVPIRRTIISEAPPMLRRANELFAIGRFDEAAETFEELARGAQARGIPQDAHLFMRAGRCRLQAGQYDFGMVDIKQGLKIMISRGRIKNCLTAGQRAIVDLQQLGLDSEADEIKAMLEEIAVTSTDPLVQAEEKIEYSLPTVCESCGANLRSDEVDWIDDRTVECPYCGKIIRTEEDTPYST